MKKTILFIEDEAALQKTLGDTLAQEGYEVTAALDGATGLELAIRKRPNLILLDLILPRVHGLDVLRKLKENNITASIPVILLTNSENIKDVDRALELGATTYLVKANYELQEIVDKISEAFGNLS